MKISRNTLVGTLIALSFGTSFVQADMVRYERAKLLSYEIDPALTYADQVSGGNLLVDYLAKEVKLTLDLNHCEPGEYCIEIARVKQIRLPIISMERGVCGIQILAERDRRPLDGNLETLRIYDARGSKCFYHPHATEIQHEIVTAGMGGPVQTFKSFLRAEMLKPTSVILNESARFETMNIDRDWLQTQNSDFFGGSITVNNRKNTLKLTLYRKKNCPPGMFCTMEVPAPYIVELPILSTGRNKCGNTTITAGRGGHFGHIERISVVDRRNDKCVYIMNPTPTSVSWIIRTNDMGQKYESSFTAGPLAPAHYQY